MLRFDLLSFLVGFVAGVGLATFVYIRRETIMRLWQALLAELRRRRDQITASVESRYVAALRSRCDRLDLTGTQINFEALYIERQFDPPPARPSTTPPDPASRAPISLSAALRSANRLAVLGGSGSGRTTLLIKLARLYLDKRAQSELGTRGDRLPLLLHLAEVNWAAANETDPLSPLVEAASAHVPRLISVNASRLVKRRVQANKSILLLDGLDEVTPTLRPTVLQWLGALLAQFPDNRVVITTAQYGYGALQNIGFVSLRLTPWTNFEVEQIAQRWIQLVSGGKQDLAVLTTGLKHIGGVMPNPIDLTLTGLDWRARASLPANQLEAYDQWIDRAIQTGEASKEHLAPDKLKAALAKMAWATYQESRIELSHDEIEQAVSSVQPASQAGDQPADAGHAAEIARDLVDRTGLLIPFGLDGWMFAHRQIAAYLAACHAVQTNAAIEIFWDQPEWADVFDFYSAMTDPGHFVGRTLAAPDDLSRTHLWTAARWTGNAALNAVGRATQADPAGARDAGWRGKVMGELARAFLQPDQFGSLRDQALVGLLATRDKGLSFLLKRGVTQPDPVIRALSLQGLGSLGREADLPLLNAALADTAPAVRAAGIRAVGSIAHNGSDEAIKHLIQAMLEQDEDGQRLAAEQLATCGEEGYQILREGAAEEDLAVRRAAAYGLAATGQEWARDLLQKLQRDDKQWFVRSAATDALSIMQLRERKPADEPPPDLSSITIDQQGWLIEWAAAQGIGIGVGRQAANALMRALDEGATPVRVAAIQTLRHVGDLSHHDKLRTLLFDPDRLVREAAFAALETIGQRTGQLIPR